MQNEKSEPKTSLLFCVNFQCLISLLLFRPVHGKWCCIDTHMHKTANIVRIYSHIQLHRRMEERYVAQIDKITFDERQKQQKKTEHKNKQIKQWKRCGVFYVEEDEKHFTQSTSSYVRVVYR